MAFSKKKSNDSKRIASETTWKPIQVKKSWPIVYSAEYDISFGKLENLHSFDTKKWGRIIGILKDKHMLKDEDIVKSKEISLQDLQLVHTQEYLDSLKSSKNVAVITEVFLLAIVPNFVVQSRLLTPLRFQVEGTVRATLLAIDRGWGVNVGGGFHHCSRERGGGFCAFADITLAVKKAQEAFPETIRRVLITDLDAHQGNGYARDFMDDKNVFIFDVYNGSIYPGDTYAKNAISCRHELLPGTKDDQYLKLVRESLEKSLNKFSPDLVVYNAGTDILRGDPLGHLDITPKGVMERDQIVFESCRSRNIPIVMLTSGGYQRNNAQVIADSLFNLHEKGIIQGPQFDSDLDPEQGQVL